MIFFSKNSPINDLHDFITGNPSAELAARIQTRRKADPAFEREVENLQYLRGTLSSLVSLPTPRSFRLSPQMVGVKPPPPRSFAWVSRAASLTAIIFGLSVGARFYDPFMPTTEANLAMESAPALLEAPMEDPMAAPMIAADAPEPAAFAEMPPEELSLQSAPAMELPAEPAMPEARSAVEEPVTKSAPIEDSLEMEAAKLPGWIDMLTVASLGITFLLVIWIFIRRAIQVRAWARKWKK